MSLRKLTVLIAAVCAGTLAVTYLILRWPLGSPGGKDSGQAAAPDETAYAYATDRALVVMRGDQVLARVPRIFDEADSANNKVVWTRSGDYVAMLSDATLRQEDVSKEELLVVNSRTGQQQRLPCPGCIDITAARENSVLAAVLEAGSGSDSGALEFDLNAPGHGTPVTLPPSSNQPFLREFLASTRDYILTAQSDYLGGSHYGEYLELLKRNGSGKTVFGDFESNPYMYAAAAEKPGGGGERIAVAFRKNPGECIAEFPIDILDTQGDVAHTDMSAAQPPGYVRGASGGMAVNDLWWGPDGRLRATIESWTCDQTQTSQVEQQTLAHPSTVWRLDGIKWVQESSAPATMYRQLSQTAAVVLVKHECIGRTAVPADPVTYCHTGKAYRERTGRRSPIADQVLFITAPPSRSAPAADLPPPSGPTWVPGG